MGLDQCITNVYTLSEAGKSVATKSLGTSKSGKIAVACARSVAHSAESYPRGAPRKNEEREYRNAESGATAARARLIGLASIAFDGRGTLPRRVADDPDAAPIDIDWSDAVLVIPVRKKAISISRR